MTNILTKACIAAASIGACMLQATSASSQEGQISIDSINSHHFLSATIRERREKILKYEVCNLSEAASAFVWTKAGFGVDSLEPLNPNLCARKELRGVTSFDRGDSDVYFQSGASGTIDTIYSCIEFAGFANRCSDTIWYGKTSEVLTTLELFIQRPDVNNVELETLTIGIRVIGDGEYVELYMESSSGIEHVVIVLPSSDANISEIQEILGERDTLEINTFGYFTELGEVFPSILTERLPSQSPALSFRRGDEFAGFGEDFKIKDISRLGEILSVLVVESSGKVAAVSDSGLPGGQ